MIFAAFQLPVNCAKEEATALSFQPAGQIPSSSGSLFLPPPPGTAGGGGEMSPTHVRVISVSVKWPQLQMNAHQDTTSGTPRSSGISQQKQGELTAKPKQNT